MEYNRIFVPPYIVEEGKKLGKEFFSKCNDDAIYNGMDLGKFIDTYASKRYKNWLKKSRKLLKTNG